MLRCRPWSESAGRSAALESCGLARCAHAATYPYPLGAGPGARCARAEDTVEEGVRGRHVSATSACSAAASLGPLGQWFLDPRRWKSLAMSPRGFTSSTGALRRQQRRTNQQRPQPRPAGAQPPGSAPARPWLIARSGLARLGCTHTWWAALRRTVLGRGRGGRNVVAVAWFAVSLNPRCSCATGAPPAGRVTTVKLPTRGSRSAPLGCAWGSNYTAVVPPTEPCSTARRIPPFPQERLQHAQDWLSVTVTASATATATERPDWHAGTCRPRTRRNPCGSDISWSNEHDRDADRG